MSRAADLVRAVPPGPPEMESHRRRVLRAIAAAPDVADRAARPGHLTGSALVVDGPGERFVLLFHSRLRRWLQPGGHADGEADLAAVALREATEETGIGELVVDPVPLDVDVHEVAPPGEDPHLHLDVRFLVRAPIGAELRPNHESEAIAWVGWDELARWDVDDSVRRLVARGRLRLG